MDIAAFRDYLASQDVHFREHANGHFQLYFNGTKEADVWATTERMRSTAGVVNGITAIKNFIEERQIITGTIVQTSENIVKPPKEPTISKPVESFTSSTEKSEPLDEEAIRYLQSIRAVPLTPEVRIIVAEAKQIPIIALDRYDYVAWREKSRDFMLYTHEYITSTPVEDLLAGWMTR